MAFIGGALTLPGHWYKTFVGIVLVLLAGVLAFRSNAPANAAGAKAVPPFLAVLLGSVIGLLSGLTGTGGGIFLSPLLIFSGWAETRDTGGVSTAFILVNSASGLAGNVASMQYLPPATPLWLAAAMIGGGIVGTELGTRRVATATVRQLLAVVLVIAGGKLIFAA